MSISISNLDALELFLQGVPQIVPEETCLRCRICCRFPDTENVQSPIWSEEETRLAQKAGASKEWFTPIPGTISRGVRLEPCGSGFRCPAFDPDTSRCTLHAQKPLDCRLYPFALTANSAGDRVVLAMDLKCPYLQEHGDDPEVAAVARRLEEYLSTPQAMAYLRSNPKVIGSWWPEYVAVASLSGIVLERQEERGVPHPALRPLLPEDWTGITPLLRRRPHALSCYSRVAWAGWQDLIHLYQMEWEGEVSLFAEQGGGWFLPLPPLTRTFRPAVVQKAWALLTELNHGGGVSRVEGIEPAEIESWRRLGFKLRPGASEYLYWRENLVHLRGNAYRSQRGAINRFRRKNPLPCRFRPFEEADRTACLQLYTRWAIQKQRQAGEEHARFLVRDGLFFHRRVLMHHREWGMKGWLAEIDGRVAAYTFGSALSPNLFCVFLEIADPVLPGLGGWLFQEFCRRMEGYSLINAMGDEGLQGLRRAKESYRPVGIARSWVAEHPGALPQKWVELKGFERPPLGFASLRVGHPPLQRKSALPIRSGLPEQEQSRLPFESLPWVERE